jgi:Type IV secretion system pilin
MTSYTYVQYTAFLAVSFLVFTPTLIMGAGESFAQGASLVPCDGSPQYPCDLCALALLITNVTQFAVYLAVIVAVMAFTYAGFLYMTASLGENRIKRAKDSFVQILIGLCIVLFIWVAVDTVMKTVSKLGGGDPQFMPWNRVCTSNR